MLVVSTIGPGVVPYFTDGRHPGRWSPGAARLLGLKGSVEAADLRKVLQGHHPSDGARLEPVRSGRRAGWDLVFGAPKSLSIFAVSDPGDGSQVAAAHVAAVAGVIGHIEDRLTLRRRAPDGCPARADGLVAAAFDHTSNRAAEPHVHTHVLVANLSRSDGRWGAVSGADWFVDRRALAALYQLALRFELGQRGLALDWRLRPDGLADLAGIPRATVRAASSPTRMVAQAGRFAARRPIGHQPSGPAGSAGPGSEGYGRFQRPHEGAGVAGLAPPGADGDLTRAVSTRLAGRRSDFRAADVIIALASAYPGGAPVAQVKDWVDRYCAQAIPTASPTTGPRWTTPAARRLDEDLVASLRAVSARPARALAAPSDSRPGPSAGRGPDADESPVGRLTGSRRVHILGAPAGRSDLVAQAELLSECRVAWEQAGLRVAVSTPGADPAVRWRVLAGLEPHHPGERPDVLIVDRADRRTSSELARLIRAGAERLVFVEGGTLPRLTNPASHGLVEVARAEGRITARPHRAWLSGLSGLSGLVGVSGLSLHLGPGPVTAPSGPPPPGAARDGRLAAEYLLRHWLDRPDAVLVGLGPEEVHALNQAVVGVTRPAGDPARFAEGDRVVVLRGRPGLPQAGTFGTVVAPAEGGTFATVVTPAGGGRLPDPGHGSLTVAWPDRPPTLITDRAGLAAIGLGYAVTPRLAARTGRPLMVLGPASSIGRGRERVVADVGLDREGAVRPLARSAGLG